MLLWSLGYLRRRFPRHAVAFSKMPNFFNVISASG